ncbi:hypothetical protein F2Q69_00022732 [Brassica cretica]|uniref:Ubiquitin-like protease family profile domain-containing protein n=1 Tax=Brassica cretica TaxID=69181 RepID=A0A8S9Q5N7_BRACR|nr:hypothetical protein F2Q69_00022732 [Brassica cretica]
MPENGFTSSLAEDVYIRRRAPALKSISYHIGDSKLFTALRQALNADEYEDLKESKLGVFINFKELNFGWASRLVHYMLSFQLNIKKNLNCDYIEDLENPRVEVTKEMAAFWEMMGVNVDAGPTTEHIKASFGRCEEWSREDRMRLRYLAIFTGFIEGRKYSTATWTSLARLVMDLERFENYPWGRVAFKVLMESLKGVNLESNSYTVDRFVQVLQVWAYFTLPEVGANFEHRLPNRSSPLLLAYNGGKGRRFLIDAISRHTSVINFVHKDYAEMLPVHLDAFINVQRQRYQDNPHHFRSERLCFIDHVWGLDVDDIYAPVKFRIENWISIWISIPKRHIVIWDSILTHIKAADLDVLMEPFVNMVPYLLVECAGSIKERVKHTLKPYTYERVTVGLAQCRAGDCGVFALKYIECHALGMSFPPDFCNKNAKAIR